MEAWTVKVSWTILMIPHVVGLIFGLVFTFAPTILGGQYLKSFTAHPGGRNEKL